jgi:hypothetical protein
MTHFFHLKICLKNGVRPICWCVLYAAKFREIFNCQSLLLFVNVCWYVRVTRWTFVFSTCSRVGDVRVLLVAQSRVD